MQKQTMLLCSALLLSVFAPASYAAVGAVDLTASVTGFVAIGIFVLAYALVMAAAVLRVLVPAVAPAPPELHQAMSIQPSADVAPNTVTFVMQKGYELNGRLLRPAMVGVSKAPE